MKHKALAPLANQRGGFLVLGAILVALLFGFAALGVEVGRWFAVKTEMAKAVDAASLAGATHFSNPNIPDKTLFMQQMAQANFHDGILGTDQHTTFVVTAGTTGKVTIKGQANVLNTMSKALFASDTVPVAALGAARLGGAEVGLVLDVSGSMGGTPLTNLKNAATQFLDNFEDTEDRNKFGLVAFADGADVRYTLQNYYHSDLAGSSGLINALPATGGTNTEYALETAYSGLGYTDQSTLPDDEKLDQYVILISDGQPTAFTGTFTRNGNEYVGVAYASTTDYGLYQPNVQSAEIGGILQYETGDGLPSGTTTCPGTPGPTTTKWHILDDPSYGVSVPAYSAILGTTNPMQCQINKADEVTYMNSITQAMAIAHAQELKDAGIVIYTIGFGSVNQSFLDPVSSGPEYRFYAASSSELEGLLQVIANRLKLKLLE